MIPDTKRIAKQLLYSLGYYRMRSMLRGRREPRLAVLMYHDLRDDDASSGESLDLENPTASQFSAHVREISRHYRVLTMREAIAEVQSGSFEQDTVVFTFDDGYASVYDLAYPVLRTYGVGATVFVLTGWINREGHMWWQELRALAARSRFDRDTRTRLREILGTPLDRVGSSHSAEEFRKWFLDSAEPWLRGLDDATLRSQLNTLRTALLPTAGALSVRDQAMTWEQLSELAANGIELAAHTHNHVNLRHTDKETAREEIKRSRAEIEERCGIPVVGFAYPYGKDINHYDTAADALRGEGFEYACTAVSGINDAGVNPFYIRRVVLPPTASPALINRELRVAFLRD